MELAQLAAGVGVERFVLDDGWFGGRRHSRAGLGDWTVSPDVWPEGLGPLIVAVQSLGMGFGLWVEPEMVNLDSDLARAHPEWVASARSGLPMEQRTQHVLDLSNADCYNHVKMQLLALLDEYPIDYLKWDHNRDAVEAGSQIRGGAAIGHQQTLAVYKMIDELRELHPLLEIESCSAGGGRIDLGILERTDRVWVSDCIDPLERQRLMRWTSQLLPPELMGAHIGSEHSHTTGRTHTLAFRAAAALFGHFGVEWDLKKASQLEREELASWIGVYKNFRNLIGSGTMVRGTDPAPDTWLTGVVALDGSEALFTITAMAWSPTRPHARVRLRGLDLSKNYLVEPLVPGDAPQGLIKPDWWTAPQTAYPATVLRNAGLQLPTMHPEQTLILHLRTADSVE